MGVAVAAEGAARAPPGGSGRTAASAPAASASAHAAAAGRSRPDGPDGRRTDEPGHRRRPVANPDGIMVMPVQTRQRVKIGQGAR